MTARRCRYASSSEVAAMLMRQVDFLKGRGVTATPPRALKYSGPSPVKRAIASVDSSHAPAEVAGGR